MAALPIPLVKVQDPAAREGEIRVTGKDHDRCCQGLMASPASQRRTVEADTDATMPLAAASRANSGQVQRANGYPLCQRRSNFDPLAASEN